MPTCLHFSTYNPMIRLVYLQILQVKYAFKRKAGRQACVLQEHCLAKQGNKLKEKELTHAERSWLKNITTTYCHLESNVLRR